MSRSAGSGFPGETEFVLAALSMEMILGVLVVLNLIGLTIAAYLVLRRK